MEWEKRRGAASFWSLLFSQSVFRHNVAAGGGAVFIRSFPAGAHPVKNVTFDHCTFERNQAQDGSGGGESVYHMNIVQLSHL